MLSALEKNEKWDSGIFEHFMGTPPKSANDQKITALISSIENQKERLESQVAGLEWELQKANDSLAMARNEIKCLSKGGVNEASKYF